MSKTQPTAIVTRYPTGALGLEYMGSRFYRLRTNNAAMIKDLKRLRIPIESIEWVEHYYDRSIPLNDPRCYKQRPMEPLLCPRNKSPWASSSVIRFSAVA